MTEAQIKHMVDRFLSWKLPENFNPDDGISFEPIAGKGGPHPFRREPQGTNLLDATQAADMVRHMLKDLPSAATPPHAELAKLIETRLLGVAPDDQDLALEDDDWRRIIAALSASAMIQITPQLRGHLGNRAASLREEMRVAAANNWRYVNPGDVESAQAEADNIDQLLAAPVFDRYAHDAEAKRIYNTWSDVIGWVPWVERGNSDHQEVARDMARRGAQSDLV
jgi:hypothetical protein